LRQFKEEDLQEYIAWRAENPRGFVLNLNNPTSTRDATNVIHRARYCPMLDQKRHEGRQTVLTKICSNDMRELEQKFDGKPCYHCMRDEYARSSSD
jgi:hypothetical protein